MLFQTNKTKKMSLESGRDTSNIEYTADYVIGLREPDDNERIKYFSDLSEQDKKPMLLELYKNRLGEQNKISAVLFDGKHTIFYDVDNFSGVPVWEDVTSDNDIIF